MLAHLCIQPLDHHDHTATHLPHVDRGVTEYLFRSPAHLDAAIEAVLYDLEFELRGHRGWSQCVNFGNFGLYRQAIHADPPGFFAPRFENAVKVGAMTHVSGYHGAH